MIGVFISSLINTWTNPIPPQPLKPVASSRYVPELVDVALGMIGLASLELKLLGPVQEYVYWSNKSKSGILANSLRLSLSHKPRLYVGLRMALSMSTCVRQESINPAPSTT